MSINLTKRKYLLYLTLITLLLSGVGGVTYFSLVPEHYFGGYPLIPVFFYIFGVDESAVAQGDAELFPVEVHVFGVTDSLFGLRVYVEQPFDSSSSDDVFADDFLRIFGSDLGIERIVRNDLYDGALFAEAEAAYCDDVYFVGYPVSFNGFLKIFSDALTGRGFTTGTSANKNLEVCCSGRQPATFFGNLFITFFAQ